MSVVLVLIEGGIARNARSTPQLSGQWALPACRAASALRAKPLTAETGVADSDISNLARAAPFSGIRKDQG
jgi:hypothetical protein